MGLKKKLAEAFEGHQFTLSEAYETFKEYPQDSVRARIYEGIGVEFSRVCRGVFMAKEDSSIVLLEGDGRNLDFVESESLDCILTDHPYAMKKSNKGGNRDFAKYKCFRYTQKDFNEKARVLKKGCFLVEFLPEESESNYEYIYEIKQMAKRAGFNYYASVPWKKGKFVSNTGRKSKNTEQVLIFSKGKARAMRPDVKKDMKEPEKKHYMSGTAKMLPTVFDFDPPKKANRIHQAEKPSALLEDILSFVTREGEVVLDQFAGSGSIGEACRNTNRFCIMIEQSKEFIEKISNRLGLVPVESTVAKAIA